MKMHLALAATLAAVCSHAAVARYDGGDAWSTLEPGSNAPSSPSLVVATTAPLSSLRRDTQSVHGTPAQPDAADRIVRLGSGRHWVNVAYGETINFIVDRENGSAQSFAWRFNVSPDTSHVDLSDVAPADFPDQGVRVFVTADPRYGGQ